MPILLIFALFATTLAQDTLLPPQFSHTAGFYSANFQLSLSHADPAVNIIYTLDGSLPDAANLSGRTYNYKQVFPSTRSGTVGPMLQNTFRSHSYSGAISISNRTSQPNYLSMITTTMPDHRGYFPTESVFKGTVVRARAFKAGSVASPIVTRTFFVTPEGAARYNLAVVSLAIQEDELFDFQRGFYTPGVDYETWRLNNNGAMDGESEANWHRGGLDHPGHFELFEIGGAPVLAQDIGVRAHGGWSRSFPRKTLRLYARNEYGDAAFRHRIFPDQPWNRYKRLLLRNGGNDHDVTIMRDATVHVIMRDLLFDRQAYRPSAVFINGEYWGIHNIRERLDKHYIEGKYGLPADSLDILEIDAQIKEGNNVHYTEMLQYIRTNRVENDAHLDWVAGRMDLDNYIDYQIAHIFARNTDWPGNNIDYWRYQAPNQPVGGVHAADGRWRWMFFDLDHSFGIWSNNASHNTMSFAVQAGGSVWPNPDWSTFLLRELLRNQRFRTRFIQRYSDLLNTTFLENRMVGIIDSIKGLIDQEMPRHTARWRGYPISETWEPNVEVLRTFANQRPSAARGHLRSHFSLGSDISVTLAVNDASMGHIRINTLDITREWGGVAAQPYPWTGSYFAGVPLQVMAIARPGFRFVRWSGSVSGSEQTAILTNPQGNQNITAEFERISGLNTVAFWHFNALPEGNLTTVFPDTGIITSARISYPGVGLGYMDRSLEGQLRVRNPGHVRELVINIPMGGFQHAELSWDVLRTEDGAWEQSVFYRSGPNAEWIPLANGLPIEMASSTHTINLANLPGIDNNHVAQVRILMSGFGSSRESGNHRIDNMRLRAVRNEAWPIPEPLTLRPEQILRSGFGLRARPQGENLQVQFSVPTGGPVRLVVRKSDGTLVDSWSGMSNGGKASASFAKWSQLPAGGYFVSLEFRSQGVDSIGLIKGQ